MYHHAWLPRQSVVPEFQCPNPKFAPDVKELSVTMASMASFAPWNFVTLPPPNLALHAVSLSTAVNLFSSNLWINEFRSPTRTLEELANKLFETLVLAALPGLLNSTSEAATVPGSWSVNASPVPFLPIDKSRLAVKFVWSTSILWRRCELKLVV